MDARDRGSPLLDAWRLVRRRWATGAAAFLLVAGAAAALLFLSRPVYRAEARLRLGEPPPASGIAPGGGLLALMRMGGDPFANDVELIRSRTLAEGVVADAALHLVLEAPRGWHWDSVAFSRAAGRDTRAARFAVEWRADGRIAVHQTAPRRRPVAVAAPGEPVSFGGAAVVFRPWRPGMPRAVAVRTVPWGEAVRRTRARIRTERARREANILDISFDHTDPGVARAAAAAVVRRFVELRSAVQRQTCWATACRKASSVWRRVHARR